MVKKTTQQIERTCFAWQLTHDVPKNRKNMAWFEILRSHDGISQTTLFNAMSDTRSKTDGGKIQRYYTSTAFVTKALLPIQELGICKVGLDLDPTVVETPPLWLDSFFETLAGLLEEQGKTPAQLGEKNFTALGQQAYLTIITPTPPPKPPPIVGSGWPKRVVL